MARTSAPTSRDAVTDPPAPPRRARLDRRDARRLVFQIAGLSLLVVVATYLPAYLTGGATDLTLQVTGGLFLVVLMWVVRAHRIQKARTNERLLWLNGELKRQHEFLGELAPLEHLQSCLEYVVQAAAKRLRCRRVSLMLPDEELQSLRIAASCGLPADVARRTRLPIGEGIAGTVFRSHQPIRTHDAATLRGPNALPLDSQAFLSGPLILSGLRWGKNVLGVLSATDPVARDRFDADDEAVFSGLCEAAAVALHNHQTQIRLKQTQVGFLNTLANLIEARDPYTRGHSERVTRYSMAIGQILGLGETALANLEAAARLHDIGKVAVPDNILGKVGPLAAWEYAAIQKHARAGAQILAQSSLAPAAVQAIRYHHERLDGSGYPEALSGPEIPLAARIISVADTFDALTSPRPYRQALTVEAALDVIVRQSNLTLDAQCVTALLKAVRPDPQDPQPASPATGNP